MTTTHISFVSFPHPPVVNPTLSIVSVLVRRGYRVSYVTSDRFKSKVSATGAEVITSPAFDPRSLYSIVPSANEIEVSRPILALATDTLTEIAPRFESDRPDLLIYDSLALAGRVIASKLRTPVIQMSPMFALDRVNFATQVPHLEYRREEEVCQRAFRSFLQSEGVAPPDYLFHEEMLNIHLFPRALQLPGDVFGKQHFYAGRCPAEQHISGQLKIKHTGRPIALVSNSTTFSRGPEFFRMCIDGLAGLGWHTILSVGANMEPLSIGPLPDHFDAIQTNSNISILPHAGLFICPGGIVTQAEAAYHGVPLIAISNGVPELEWVSENIPRLGTGIHIRQADLNSARIRHAAIQIRESQAILNKVRQLKNTVRREAGGEETANRIEEFLESGT
jgi:MGT family glycosyltransferase